MTLCSKCKVRPAIMFVTKMEGDKTTSEGYCLTCAKELGIAPIDEMLKQFGVSEEEFENMNDQMTSMIQELEDNGAMESLGMMDMGEDMDGGAATAPFDFIKNMFGPKSDSASANGKTEKKGKQRPGKKSMLDTYGTNLTAKAALGEVDRVVNRDREIDRVIQILNRRSKNNPVLLGEPGVGKTAVAEGLACKIFEKSVPPKLFDYQLYLIDFTALVAGTQFRGQFEARLKGLLAEAEERKNVILVIDEIHNIVAAGDAEGAMSAANILKPALARGEIQIIGATTLTEYRKHIEKDSALERRFQPVLIDEPSVEESIEILKGIKDYYENYHTVKITDDVIETAVRMSERYITDRFLPDKAIDVIDEAGSRVNLENKALYEAKIIKEKLDELYPQIKEAEENQDYEKSANLKSEILRLESDYDKKNQIAHEAKLTSDDVAGVIETWTKIPVHRLTEDEAKRLLNLEELIHEHLIGQDEAVCAVSKAIRRGRADITTRRRPVSFIFAGPTGVGKTELVKTIARVMFNSEDALIRVDMSEYMEKHSVSKLIGSPPGYVGYDDAGQLTEKVRRNPYSVILLDEIEKADSEVFNLFLQILDDGRIADSHGKMINFENTIIIMTTNAGSEFSASSLGFMSSEEVSLSDNVQRSLKRRFRPEFLNRIDEIVTFKPLGKDELRKIIDLMLRPVTDKLSEKNITLNVSDDAKSVILEKGYDTKYGARPLKRAIETTLEDKLAKLSLTGELKEGSVVSVNASGDDLELCVITK